MTDRISCCIPFCHRTKKHVPDVIDIEGVEIDLASEWICGHHWRDVGGQQKAMHSAAKRRVRKYRDLRAAKVGQRIWGRCVAQAIERAAGI